MIAKRLALALLLLGVFPHLGQAQDSLSLSVTPTFFEISAAANEAWDDSITVVNSNQRDITVYVTLARVVPSGEYGAAQYEPVDPRTDDGPAGWFQLPETSFTIPAEQSIEIPFSVRTPTDPPPGGQYFALMVRTEPPSDPAGAYQVRTAQVVSSLIFMNIAGEVVESGHIRSLRVADRWVSGPSNTFSLRFENTGTVHLRPRGEMVIKNMWGTERGRVTVNDHGQFGNVLPDSIRTFRYEWSAEPTWSDFGLYTAEAVLAYGQEERQFSNRSVTFFVFPVLRILLVVSILLALVGSIVWSVRWYVRRALVRSGLHPERVQRLQRSDASAATPTQPDANDVVVGHAQTDTADTSSRWGALRLFGGGVAVVLLIGLLWWYVLGVTATDHEYETEAVPPPGQVE